MFDARRYSEWLARSPLTAEYRHYALQLRLLSAPAGTTWALKSPSHLGHLDALLDVLPESTVVVCHRDPLEAVASYASLVYALRRAYSDRVAADVVGGHALERTATAMARVLDVRDGDATTRCIDVAYSALARDPVAAVARVYGELGRTLAPDVEEAMERWVSANPRGRHGRHHYDLARFGLTDADVRRAFSPYLSRFGALVEG
jgi:hypothetical protein